MALPKISLKLDQANQYFCEKMEIVYIYTGRVILDFFELRSKTMCYYISTWAIIGLEDGDRRLVGTIDSYPDERGFVYEDYKHAWVEFKHKGEWYVYDSLVNRVLPRDIWYEACNPRAITSNLSREDILGKYMTPDYLLTIKENSDYVFKWEAPKEDDCEDLGYLYGGFRGGHLYGWSYNNKLSDFNVECFVARTNLT